MERIASWCFTDEQCIRRIPFTVCSGVAHTRLFII
jgi:hypothetical protein